MQHCEFGNSRYMQVCHGGIMRGERGMVASSLETGFQGKLIHVQERAEGKHAFLNSKSPKFSKADLHIDLG